MRKPSSSKPVRQAALPGRAGKTGKRTPSTQVEVTQASFEEIRGLRDLYRQEMNCQIVHDSLPQRGFGPMYLLHVDGELAGHGCIVGFGSDPKDIVNEFYLLHPFRSRALPLFREFLSVSKARRIEAQTNDRLLTLLLFDCAKKITSDTIVFADSFATAHRLPGVTFRRARPGDAGKTFKHSVEPVGDWLLEIGGVITATGGIALHYNIPYADLFMEVHPEYRLRGHGRYLIQELKRATYSRGCITAARCNSDNTGSRATLQGAGLLPCARILSGGISS